MRSHTFLYFLGSISLITECLALPSDGSSKNRSAEFELKSYPVSIEKTHQFKSLANELSLDEPLYLSAFGITKETADLSLFEPKQAQVRKTSKPGKTQLRLWWARKWRPLRDWDGLVQGIKITYKTNLIGELSTAKLVIDARFMNDQRPKDDGQCDRKFMDKHAQVPVIYISIFDRYNGKDWVSNQNACVLKAIPNEGRDALKRLLIALPFYFESLECNEREILPIVALLMSRTPTDCENPIYESNHPHIKSSRLQLLAIFAKSKIISTRSLWEINQLVLGDTGLLDTTRNFKIRGPTYLETESAGNSRKRHRIKFEGVDSKKLEFPIVKGQISIWIDEYGVHKIGHGFDRLFRKDGSLENDWADVAQKCGFRGDWLDLEIKGDFSDITCLLTHNKNLTLNELVVALVYLANSKQVIAMTR